VWACDKAILARAGKGRQRQVKCLFIVWIILVIIKIFISKLDQYKGKRESQ